MKGLLTPQDMKSVDNNTAYNNIPTILLMENAGSQIAYYIINNYPDKKNVSIYSGTGGNGGDGFVIARHLLNHDYRVHLFLLAKAENIKNQDSLLNWNAIVNVSKADEKLKIEIVTDSSQLKPDNSDIIIDAILGTGVKGKIRQPTSKAIDTINFSPATVISVDVPSGLNPLTGEVEDKCVIANTTLTLHKPKTGIIKAQNSYTGNVEVLDIGIPKVSEIYTGRGDLLKIPQAGKDSHKGQNGSVLIVGSNPDYVGAVIFAASACTRMGMDLVYIIAPESSANIIKQYNPEFIVKSTAGDILDESAYDDIYMLSQKVDSILIGSGSGVEEKTAKLFNKILCDIDKNIIIDADALKVIDKENLKESKCIVTPHQHEFEELFSIKLPSRFDKKILLLQELSAGYDTTIILKGPTDIISTKDDYKLNDTGNQGMTVGGTGDILAGLVTALSTKLTLFEAAYISTFIIGCAGDKLYEKKGYNYTALDIIDKLNDVIS